MFDEREGDAPPLLLAVIGEYHFMPLREIEGEQQRHGDGGFPARSPAVQLATEFQALASNISIKIFFYLYILLLIINIILILIKILIFFTVNEGLIYEGVERCPAQHAEPKRCAMAKEKNHNLYIVAIIAVVAIFALVLFRGNAGKAYGDGSYDEPAPSYETQGVACDALGGCHQTGCREGYRCTWCGYCSEIGAGGFGYKCCDCDVNADTPDECGWDSCDHLCNGGGSSGSGPATYGGAPSTP